MILACQYLIDYDSRCWIPEEKQKNINLYPGGDSHMKVTGMLVVSLRVVNIADFGLT